ncbi:MAG: hypothetical protein ACRCVN_03415 [Spirochaetia bacterium]
MMRSIFASMLCLCVLLTPASILAQTAIPEDSSISVTARYYNKQVYYPNTPILIKVSVRNNSSRDFVLQLADEPILNLDVRVKSLTNVALQPSEAYFTRLSAAQPFVYRLMNLRPGEEYSFDFDVRQFVDIGNPGTYIVELDFIPSQLSATSRMRYENLPTTSAVSTSANWEERLQAMIKGRSVAAQAQPLQTSFPSVISSNALGLTVRPAVNNKTALEQMISEDTGEVLSRQVLAPDEVVSYTLESRQRDQWNKFFLYINLESLFLNNTDRNRRFRVADTKTKDYMLENFRNQLINQEIELGVASRPYSFKVLSVYYTEENAYVLTRQVYRQPQYDEIKEYTWFLRKENGFWAIYNYEVKNLGTE